MLFNLPPPPLLLLRPSFPSFPCGRSGDRYTWLILVGFVRDLFGRKLCRRGTRPKPGYAPLLADFEDFFQRRLYMRAHDCWDRPICSAPGPHIDVVLRDFKLMCVPINRTSVYCQEGVLTTQRHAGNRLGK